MNKVERPNGLFYFKNEQFNGPSLIYVVDNFMRNHKGKIKWEIWDVNFTVEIYAIGWIVKNKCTNSAWCGSLIDSQYPMYVLIYISLKT